MRWFFVLLIAATASGQKDYRYWREDANVAIHRWISTDENAGPATSWSTGIAPRTRATETLTLAANAGNTETVTLGSKTYTWQTVLTDVDGNVLIGASASDSLDNLIAAINLAAGAGTTYAASTTANTDATAAAGAGDTMDVEAISYITTVGNAVVSTETMANGSWGDVTLGGGVVNWNVTDEVICGGGSGGTTDMVTNLNMDEVVIAHWTVTPAYKGTIGGSGNQLQIEITSTTAGQANLFTHRGSKSVHVSFATGGFADIVLDSSNLSNALFLDGTIRNLWIKRGRCDVDAGASLTQRVELLGSDAICVVPSSIAAAPNVHIKVEAGELAWGASTSTTAGNRMISRGGTWTQTGEIQSQTAIEMEGGELIYKPAADTSDTPDLYATSGFLDLSQTDRAVQFDDIIRGPDMDIIGDFAQGGTPSGLSVLIDLGDDYPR